MGLIEDFVARYRKEYDFYDQAARLVAQTLETSLQAAGIRAIVTSRAKSIQRLEAKCRQRAPTKNYAAVDDIYRDIVDLAGVRVALYFPAERTQVDRLVRQLLVVTEPAKDFPAPSTPTITYTKRFSGYWATHYRVQLKDVSLSEAHKRYAEARVEVQVASVLMHAWAEVEHDLVYKPLEGTLSQDEYAVLDELNGLVIAGEIALERLQRAAEARVAGGERSLSNHYDLASHILNKTAAMMGGPLGESALGRIDLLFKLLVRLDLATPDRLGPYIDALHTDTERRPIAEQMVDRLLAEDEARYKLYEEVRASDQIVPTFARAEERLEQPGMHEAMGFFLTQWIALEQLLRDQATESDRRHPVMPTSQALARLGLDPDSRTELERIRRLRNNLVHGIEVPDQADLMEAGRRLEAIVARLLQVRA